MNLEHILTAFRSGQLGLDEAIAQVQGFETMGHTRLDLSRMRRTGFAEVIYGPNKTVDQLKSIFERFAARGENCLATRISEEQAKALLEELPDLKYEAQARVLKGLWGTPPKVLGQIALLSAGTADIPVASEALSVALFLGAQVKVYYDVGVAGPHRLFHQLDLICQADVVIVVAGMDGALPSLVGGLVRAPVIAVPTSVGYGAGFEGLAPLLTMLNTCAAGVTVVNIDNGFGAAFAGAKILLMAQEKGAS